MQPDGIGPRRRAQSENAFRFSGMARFLDDQIPRREAKPGEHDDMARSRKSAEAAAVLRFDLDPRLQPGGAGGGHVLRAVCPGLPGRLDAADEDEMWVRIHRRGVPVERYFAFACFKHT